MKPHKSRSATIRRATPLAAVGIIMLTATVSHAADSSAVMLKSRSTATALSLTATLAPFAMVVMAAGGSNGEGGGSPALGILLLTGVTAGPGLGHLYAGNAGQFWRGTGLRLAGLTATTIAMAASWDNPDASGAAVAGFGGMGLVVVSAIYDVATAGKSADRYNSNHTQARVSVAPTYLAAQNAPGIVVSVRF